MRTLLRVCRKRIANAYWRMTVQPVSWCRALLWTLRVIWIDLTQGRAAAKAFVAADHQRTLRNIDSLQRQAAALKSESESQ